MIKKKKAEAQRDICVLLLAATLLTIINTIAKTEKQPKYILMTAGYAQCGIHIMVIIQPEKGSMPHGQTCRTLCKVK